MVSDAEGAPLNRAYFMPMTCGAVVVIAPH
jgi:hypothetical protein